MTIASTGTYNTGSISFTINGITNPNQGTSGLFQLQTYDVNGYKIDQNVNTVTFTPDC